MPFAWEKRFRLKGIGHGAASSSWNNSDTHGWFLQRGLLEEACAVAPWLVWVPAVAERLEGKHRAGDWATRWPAHPCSSWWKNLAMRVAFGGEEVYSSSAKYYPDFLNRERVESPFLWGDVVPWQHVRSLVHCARHMHRLQWAQIGLSLKKKVVCQRAEVLRDEAALVIYAWHHGLAVWVYQHMVSPYVRQEELTGMAHCQHL